MRRRFAARAARPNTQRPRRAGGDPGGTVVVAGRPEIAAAAAASRTAPHLREDLAIGGDAARPVARRIWSAARTGHAEPADARRRGWHASRAAPRRSVVLPGRYGGVLRGEARRPRCGAVSIGAALMGSVLSGRSFNCYC
ncbi:MAG: hypothetical protein EKK44_09455 [Methylobacterium sp.]|nr:MAG: hypothetical protein EKK44_09455 [Methylobacterium sp.]